MPLDKLFRNAILLLYVVLSFAESAHAVPRTMLEAFAEIDTLLPADERAAFLGKAEPKATADMHFRIGLHIRNEWLRPRDSRLAEELRDYGARSFDEMSSLLLSAYWSHSNGKAINLQEKKACYRRWFAESRKRLQLADEGIAPYKEPEFSCSGA